jgi:hypothetical protein
MKPLPEMLSVKSWLPAVMLAGNMPVTTGVGISVAEVEVVVQLPRSTLMPPSATRAASAVHRECIKPILQ